MVKSARLTASGREGVCNVLAWQYMSLSVVGVGSIEQISKFPSRFTTNGQQIVASPIVAASKGTGTI
jgi:hypothetical protein